MRNAGRTWWAGLALLLAWGCSAWGAQAMLVADAHVNSAQPAVNSGALSNLNVGGGYISLVQFDLGPLPAGTASAQVSRAILLLYCNRADTPGTVSVAPVSANWAEYGVTYAALPVLGSSVATATVSAAGQYVALDVTATVQGWIASSAANHGLALSADAASMQFDSKENDETGHAPMLEIMLAGPVGATGAVGPAGAAGSAGPIGPQGPAGVPGSAGAQGIQGVPGVAGAQGAIGLMGPVGPMGATGAVGPAGTQGPVGPAGPQGPAGVQGLAGPKGDVGPQGPVGMTFRGAYAPAMVYDVGDGVLYGGAAYVSLAVGNEGNVPDENPAVWSMFASGGAGPAGPQGPAGVQGPMGPVGPQGPVGTQGAAGPQGVAGPVGAVGPAGPAGLMGVQGAQGPAGPQGVAGAAGMRFRGAWDAGMPYAANDAVSFRGSTYLAATSNAAEQPDLYPVVWGVMAAAGGAGPAGPSGPSGQAATVAIGSVATGPAGSLATVTNSGSPAAAVLNFVIPQGAAGIGGTTGSGTSSALPVSVYHAVSFSYTYYSLSSTASGVEESAPVLTWMPQACTATSLQMYSQQANAVTVRLRQGVLGAMADTALSCTAASDSQCTATGSVAIPAGSFVDISVTGADGTPSAVWTSLGCS